MSNTKTMYTIAASSGTWRSHCFWDWDADRRKFRKRVGVDRDGSLFPTFDDALAAFKEITASERSELQDLTIGTQEVQGDSDDSKSFTVECGPIRRFFYPNLY